MLTSSQFWHPKLSIFLLWLRDQSEKDSNSYLANFDRLNQWLFAAASRLAGWWFWQVTTSTLDAFESHSVLFYRDAFYHAHRHTVQAQALHSKLNCELYQWHLYRQSIVLQAYWHRCHNLNRFIEATASDNCACQNVKQKQEWTFC